MNKGLINLTTAMGEISIQKTVGEIIACNDFTAEYGLTLSEKDAAELAALQAKALKSADRIEFGGGILPKLIRAFCGSPYIDGRNYAETLSELQEAFYFFKSESLDRLSDDELIEIMVAVFDGVAGGSVEYLTGTSLEILSRYAKLGFGRATV